MSGRMTEFFSPDRNTEWAVKVTQDEGSSWARVRVYRNNLEIDHSYAESTPPFYVWPPMFFERWFGVTMESKIKRAVYRAHKYIGDCRSAEEATRRAIASVGKEFNGA